jgi:hypothetical protein
LGSDRTDFYGGSCSNSEHQLIILRVLLHRKSLSFNNFVKLPVNLKFTISNIKSQIPCSSLATSKNRCTAAVGSLRQIRAIATMQVDSVDILTALEGR